MYAMTGFFSLLLAFCATAVSVVLLFASFFANKRKLARAGAISSFISAGLLTVCCVVLEVCFFAGDTSILYVLEETSHSTSGLAWLYKLAGLWGGSAGSLLFWAWLISIFNVLVGVRVFRAKEPVLDVLALGVSELVLLAFLGVLSFSETYMPFIVTPSSYFNADGSLTESASALGMNMLLEHWAMAIHPPTLFIGYAGFTIPFAYAIATLILNDSSDTWVRKATPFALVSWIFLTIGIGLGSVWAYAVLGWGGYWGWDPVENASLLPWLVGLALIHSFTLYRQRGMFKRWAILCACLALTFVILGTFITRSGIVQSVHAFSGDAVSLYLFLSLILVSFFAGVVGIIIRWKSLASDTAGGDDIESFASRDAAYYVNNLLVVIFAFVLTYFTLASALPSWMPLGGLTIATSTYEAIARPIGILYCALIAVCPLLSWGKTSGKTFWKKALVPGICALVVFAGLMVIFATELLPAYNAIIAAGGTAAEELQDYGPAWYYNGLAVVGFLVASLLLFNALFTFARTCKGAKGNVRGRMSALGGSLAHASMGLILIGLIGSSMYVTEQSINMGYDDQTDTATETITIGDYELTYTGASSAYDEEKGRLVYDVFFDVTRDGQDVGSVAPRYELSLSTYSTKLDAGIMHFADEDLFVVFGGLTSDYAAMYIQVRTNPLIGFVWAGFALMVVGMVFAAFARRSPRDKAAASAPAEMKPAPVSAAASSASRLDGATVKSLMK